MERTKVKWRKIGGGNFRLGNRIIKPNEVFTASPDEIPQLFRKFFVQMEQVPDEPEIVRSRKKFEVKPVEEDVVFEAAKTLQDKVLPESPMEYQVEEAAPGWFNVVNTVTGKQLNEKKLRKADAEKVMMELNG
jgi:hypothetical protein